MPFAPRILRTLMTIGPVMIIGVANGIPCAYAQPDDTIGVERRDAARRLFEQGEQAYAVHDYVLAAKAFEDAFQIVPHYAALWNAARSSHRAGDGARAANGYAQYLQLAPADAPDRDEATMALAELANELGRIDIVAGEFEIVQIDGVVVNQRSIYVHPGEHVIEGQTGERRIKIARDVEKGGIRSVALVEMEPSPLVESVPVIDKKPELALSASSLRKSAAIRATTSTNWFGPAAIVAGSATIVTSSLLVWSGVDTLTAREQFDITPTTEKLADGRDKQLRTNLFLGATVTSAIATGIFTSLWKWKGSPANSAVTVLPPSLGLPMQIMAIGRF